MHSDISSIMIKKLLTFAICLAISSYSLCMDHGTQPTVAPMAPANAPTLHASPAVMAAIAAAIGNQSQPGQLASTQDSQLPAVANTSEDKNDTLSDSNCAIQSPDDYSLPCQVKADMEKFPCFQDVAYRIPENNCTLAALYEQNNKMMNQIIQAAKNLQEKKGDSEFNFSLLANNECLQQLIASSTNLDIQYVRLYISRGIAWHVKTSKSTDEALMKIQCCIHFWDNNQKHLLLSFLALEDLLIMGLFDIQAHLTQLVFYKTKFTDFFCSDAVPFHLEVYRKIGREKLPYTTARITKKAHFFEFKRLNELINKQEYIRHNEKLKEITEDIARLSAHHEPFFRKLASFSMHDIYQHLSISDCMFLNEILDEIDSVLTSKTNWPGRSYEYSQHAFQNTAHTVPHDSDIIHYERLAKHIDSSLITLFLDFHGLSILFNMPNICQIIEEIGAVFSEPIKPHTQDVEGIIETIKDDRHHNQLVGQLLGTINDFINFYDSVVIPVAIPFLDVLGQREEMPLHSMFRMDPWTITRENLITPFVKLPCSNEQTSELSDKQVVDFLMKTYFPEECIQQKSKTTGTEQCKKNAPQRKKKKSHSKIHNTTACKKNSAQAINAFTESHDKISQEVTPTIAATSCAPAHTSFVLKYHKRVLRWFNHDFSQKCPDLSVLYHTYAPSCDRYILQKGQQDLWEGNIRHRLPAKITRQDGSYAYVICSCTLNSEGKIYHRGYDFSSIQNIKNVFGITITDKVSDFDQEEPFIVHHRDARFKNRSHLIENNDRSTVLYDPINKIYVQLFYQ